MVILRTLVFVFGFVLLGERSFADERSPAQLIEALRGGGHTLYIRHAATDWSQSDTVVKFGDWKSCDPGKMRQLSDAGRITSERIGIAMRALEIPIGKVLSSEYCRAIETAERLAIGTVEATTDIMNLRAAHFVGGDNAAVARLQEILKRRPATGKNTVISAHGNLVRSATGAYPGEGGAVVIVADQGASAGFRVLGQLDPGDWIRLAEMHTRQ